MRREPTAAGYSDDIPNEHLDVGQKKDGSAEAATSPSHGPYISSDEKRVNRRNDTTTRVSAARVNVCEDATDKHVAAAADPSPPPTNDDWNEIGRVYLPFARLGYASAARSRESYLATLAQNDVDEAVLENLIAGLATFQEKLLGLAALLDIAADHSLVALNDLKTLRNPVSED